MSSYHNEIAVSNVGGEAALPSLTTLNEQTTRESKKCHLVCPIKIARRIKMWGLS